MFYYNPYLSVGFNVFANTMVAVGAGVVLYVVCGVVRLLFTKVFKNR